VTEPSWGTGDQSQAGIVGEAQVCVIGAGIMGLSAAYQMALRGLDVLVLERSRPGLEASAANAGTLCLQNKHITSIPLVIYAIQMWRRFSDELDVDVEYEKRGGFRLAHTPEDVARLEKEVQAQRGLGVATEMVYQPQLSREAPYLRSDVLAASFCADDGMANPLVSVRALLKGATARGVRIWHPCAVSGIDVRGDDRFLVRTERGVVRCTSVLSAAGAWNGVTAAMVGVSLPITFEPLQVLTTDTAPPIFPHIVTHIRGNLTLKQVLGTGKVLIGGAWKGEGDLATGLKRVRRDGLIGNLAWACQNIPGIAQTSLLRAWVGLEGRTPDKLLISGSVGSPRGFHVLGCSGGGYTVSPAAGVLAAQHVLGEQPDLPWEPFHVRRFIDMTSPHDA
jgi:glycine/D-amino acid oxidase-like deaminating enzyme